ncbi:MAG TPA: HEPN domain-containing protein [Paludibacter sp.]|nr:HEPN domain-containing protein [Paludibacter sp.]
MKAALDRFLSELEQLEKYIQYIDSVGSIIRYTPVEADSVAINDRLNATKAILGDLPLRKVFEYNSIVVSMYGFFEKFIETVLVGYLDQLCGFVPNFSNLPSPVKENHSILSAQLIQNLKVPKYENENISLIATKLHNCLVNDKSELNTIAFTDHTSNFRISSITEFFSRIGIKSIGSKIKLNENFHAFLNERLGSDLNIHITEEKIIFNLLSDLAQRRNDISHGTGLENTILNNSIFPEYIEFLRQFSNALFEILRDATLEYECGRDFAASSYVAIFDHNILCLEVKDINISVGDRIIVRSGSASNYIFFERIIEEIQINNVSHANIAIQGESTRVGFKLNGRVKKNQSFYLKRTGDL